MEIFNDCLDFPVSQQGVVRGQVQALVQKRMVIENAWLWAGVFIRAAIPTRVGQLQTDDQPIVGTGCHNMFASQSSSQLRKASSRSRGGEKLVRVRTCFVRHSNRLSTPDQLAATAAKPLPSTKGLLRRRPVRSRVPTLHGLNSDPVADFEWTAIQGPAQRRLGSSHDLGIAWDLQVESLQVSLKSSNSLQAAQAKDWTRAQGALRRSGNPKTASPPSNAIPTRTKQLAE